MSLIVVYMALVAIVVGLPGRPDIASLSPAQLNAYRAAFRTVQASSDHWDTFSRLYASCGPLLSAPTPLAVVTTVLRHVEGRLGQPIPYWDFPVSPTVPVAFLEATDNEPERLPNPLYGNCQLAAHEIDSRTLKEIQERVHLLPLVSEPGDRFGLLFDALSAAQGSLAGCLTSLETAASHPLWFSMLSYVVTMQETSWDDAERTTQCPAELVVPPPSTATMLPDTLVQNNLGQAIPAVQRDAPASSNTVQLFVPGADGTMQPGPVVTRATLRALADLQKAPAGVSGAANTGPSHGSPVPAGESPPNTVQLFLPGADGDLQPGPVVTQATLRALTELQSGTRIPGLGGPVPGGSPGVSRPPSASTSNTGGSGAGPAGSQPDGGSTTPTSPGAPDDESPLSGELPPADTRSGSNTFPGRPMSPPETGTGSNVSPTISGKAAGLPGTASSSTMPGGRPGGPNSAGRSTMGSGRQPTGSHLFEALPAGGEPAAADALLSDDTVPTSGMPSTPSQAPRQPRLGLADSGRSPGESPTGPRPRAQTGTGESPLETDESLPGSDQASPGADRAGGFPNGQGSPAVPGNATPDSGRSAVNSVSSPAVDKASPAAGQRTAQGTKPLSGSDSPARGRSQALTSSAQRPTSDSAPSSGTGSASTVPKPRPDDESSPVPSRRSSSVGSPSSGSPDSTAAPAQGRPTGSAGARASPTPPPASARSSSGVADQNGTGGRPTGDNGAGAPNESSQTSQTIAPLTPMPPNTPPPLPLQLLGSAPTPQQPPQKQQTPQQQQAQPQPPSPQQQPSPQQPPSGQPNNQQQPKQDGAPQGQQQPQQGQKQQPSQLPQQSPQQQKSQQQQQQQQQPPQQPQRQQQGQQQPPPPPQQGQQRQPQPSPQSPQVITPPGGSSPQVITPPGGSGPQIITPPSPPIIMPPSPPKVAPPSAIVGPIALPPLPAMPAPNAAGPMMSPLPGSNAEVSRSNNVQATQNSAQSISQPSPFSVSSSASASQSMSAGSSDMMMQEQPMMMHDPMMMMHHPMMVLEDASSTADVAAGSRLILHLFLPALATKATVISVVANMRQIGHVFIVGGPGSDIGLPTGLNLHRMLDVTRAYNAFLNRDDAQPIQLAFTTTALDNPDRPQAYQVSAYFEWVCTQ